MTKSIKKLVTAADQLSLFDTLRRDQEELANSRPGRLCCSAKIMAAIKEAIRQAPKSREQLADEMSLSSGQSVTVSMLNNWTAASHPHYMPLELAAAFCEATGNDDIIKVQTELRGLYIVESPDVIRAKIRKLDEEKKQLDREKHKYSALLEELEGKQ